MKNNGKKCMFSININRNILKILMIMKLTTFFFLISILSVAARGYSQHARLNLSLKNASIQELFQEIEKQSEFNFFYKDDQIDINKMVSIESDNSLIGEVLNQVFENSGVSYTVVNKVIVITPRKEQEQQNIKVTGTVTASTGETLPGVTILVKGTETGTITGMDGKYSIDVPDTNSVLVFSYVGYKTQEVNINDRTVVDVILEEGLEALEEVIVVGYGTQKKVNLTGSVSTVNLDNVEYRPVTELSQVLSGASAGITVIQTDAQPGSDGATIYIRGLNTLNNTTPLVVIDGIVGNLYDVHPSDVETMSILKDASASAIYGARAANGVILITTKRGKAGKLNVNYDYYYGIQDATRLPEAVSNSATYMELLNEYKVNAGKQPFYSDATIEEWRNGNDPILYANTDWMDYLLGNTAAMQSHSFSINGGTEPARFRISFNYLDQDGIIDKTHTNQYTFRTNFDSKVSDRFSFGLNMSGKWRDRQQPGSIDRAFRGLSTNPMVLPQHPDGRYGGAQTPEDGNVWNVRKEIDTYNELLETQNFMSKVFASFEILDGLVLRGNAALDFQNRKEKDYQTTWEVWNFHTDQIDQTSEAMWLSDYQSRDKTITLYTTLEYTKTFAEKHNLHLLTGYNQEEYRTDNLSGYISKFANDELFVLNAGLNVESQTNSGTASEWSLRSYFGRLNYNYEGKYLLEANLRYDGSSRFASENRWGLFPSFSGGWRISEESFMQDLDVINNLKIRASWGKIGNNAIGNYRYLSLYNFNRNYVFDNSVVPGVAVGSMANNDIMWETTITTDLGLDIGFLKNMVELSGDYFIKRTEDILITVPIPYLIGDLGAPTQNVGTVENKGWELSLTHRNSVRDFNYSLNFNISHVENKVVKYSDVDAISGGFLLREGLPVWSLYGYNVVGIFQDQDEVDGHAFQNPMTGPGDLKYEDQITVDTNDDGIPDETDGVIDGDDRVVLGNPFPEYYYGLNLNLSYKGIDFSALFQGISKQNGYLRGAFNTPFNNPDRGIFTTKWLDRWTPENPDTDVPRLNENNLSGGYSSFWVQDNSYLRLKNLQLGYTLPESLTRKISAENIRIYANAQNLFVLTKFEGFDPERGIRQTGVGYPLHRTITFGIGITF